MIAVDIGNTNLNFAWFRNDSIVKTRKLLTKSASKSKISRVIPKNSGERIIICSVVPKITKIFKSLYQCVYVAGENLKVPIRCLYSKKDIGMDRLVGAMAARKFFPKTRLVLDFGTAITLDFLSSRGEYQGGIILPGIGSTLKVFSKCALLPSEVKFRRSRHLIPKNTKESINCGLEKGFSAMINSLVVEYKKKLKIPAFNAIVITGGEAKVVIPELNFDYKHEPALVIKGLQLIGNQILP